MIISPSFVGIRGSELLGGDLSTLAQLAASSATLAVFDYTDTTSMFRHSALNGAVNGQPIRSVHSVKGLNGQAFIEWVNAQPNQVGDGTQAVSSFQSAEYNEWLGPDSFRVCRNDTGAGRVEWYPPSYGWWYVEGEVQPYDGAVAGITDLGGRCFAGTSADPDLITGGGVGSTFRTVQYVGAATQYVGFRNFSPDAGCRVNNLKLVKLPDYSMKQATYAPAPQYNNGLVFDGVDDSIAMPIGASNADFSNCSFVFVLKTTDLGWTTIDSPVPADNIGFAEGSASSPADTFGGLDYTVDGVAITPNPVSRAGFRGAVNNGAARVVTIEGANFNDPAASDLTTGVSGQEIDGVFMLIAALDRSDPNYATALALAESEASRQITELGL